LGLLRLQQMVGGRKPDDSSTGDDDVVHGVVMDRLPPPGNTL
jgi:hypothetical protein